MNEEQKDQQLDAAYRRASASAAGRPDAKTRAAILAEAAASARRRAPAANESRYLMRAVAGLAVIGVGLLVWRQADHRLPGEARTFEVPVAQQRELAAESAYVPDPIEAPAPDAQQDEAPQASAIEPPAAAELRAPPPPLPLPRAPAPPEPTVSESASAPTVSERGPAQDSVERSELEEVQVTGARVQRPRRTVGPRNNVPAPAGASAAQDIARNEPSTEELLREHLPDQYQAATPRRVWLVRDAGGNVTRTGELAPGQQLDGQLASIRQSLGVRELTVESVQSLRNARGQLVEISLLRAR
jgi:hypothetical protein